MKVSISMYLLLLLTLGPVKGDAQNSKMQEPIGKLVDIGGYQLHLVSKGASKPTLIVEGGAGALSLQWLTFQEEISKHFRVVLYDRAGFGWSDASPYSRTAGNIADELHAALTKEKIEPPYVLLGHSYGGLIIKAFTKKYANEVNGLIFADAATEYQFEKLPPMVKMILQSGMKNFKQAGTMARKGAFDPRQARIDSSISSKYWESYQYMTSRSSHYDAMYNQMDLLPITYSQSSIEKQLNIPILVITAGNSFGAFDFIPDMPIEESNKVWMDLQRNLTNLSKSSNHRIINDATHELLITSRPELEKYVIEFVQNLRF